MSEQFEADYKLTRNLELLTDKLQQTYRELEGEKEKTDRWVIAFFRTTLNLVYDYFTKSKRGTSFYNPLI